MPNNDLDNIYPQILLYLGHSQERQALFGPAASPARIPFS